MAGGRKPKTTWRACSICGTMEGRVPPRGKTPGRLKLDRFGMDGVGCLTCYDRLAKKAERRVKAERKARDAMRSLSGQQKLPV